MYVLLSTTPFFKSEYSLLHIKYRNTYKLDLFKTDYCKVPNKTYGSMDII